jgi:hypothetical protein
MNSTNEGVTAWQDSLAVLVIVAIIGAVYWPVAHADFVWDDRIFIHDAAWLRQGDEWIHLIFRPVLESDNYFRPLGLALFVAEARLFGASAPAIHLVSLAIHLVNVILVGALSRKLIAVFAPNAFGRTGPYMAMLIFGLHPLLVEPVVWISCQFELVTMLLILLALLLNLSIRNAFLRALMIGTCFFLAACIKEAAIVLPVLLVMTDWLCLEPHAGRPGYRRFFAQAPVYAAIVAAGLAYLALRYWGLGYLLAGSAAENWNLASRLQLVAYTFVVYLKMILWPMHGLGPLHVEDTSRFKHLSFESAGAICLALAFVAYGMREFWKKRPLGGLIAGLTIAIAPVLRILPVDFDDSVYHDRFAMTSIAMACAFLPATLVDLSRRIVLPKRSAPIAMSMTIFWLALAVLNIRVTIPLWSDEVLLWQWALRDNPESTYAQNNLLSRYIDRGDLARARPLAASLAKTERDSTNAMLNLAQLAVRDNDAAGAKQALDAVERAMQTQAPLRQQVVGFIALKGDVQKLEGDLPGAEAAYRDAAALDPTIPTPHLSLAVVLALQGKRDDARVAAEAGIALMAPDDQLRRRKELARILAKPDSSQ